MRDAALHSCHCFIDVLGGCLKFSVVNSLEFIVHRPLKRIVVLLLLLQLLQLIMMMTTGMAAIVAVVVMVATVLCLLLQQLFKKIMVVNSRHRLRWLFIYLLFIVCWLLTVGCRHRMRDLGARRGAIKGAEKNFLIDKLGILTEESAALERTQERRSRKKQAKRERYMLGRRRPSDGQIDALTGGPGGLSGPEDLLGERRPQQRGNGGGLWGVCGGVQGEAVSPQKTAGLDKLPPIDKDRAQAAAASGTLRMPHGGSEKDKAATRLRAGRAGSPKGAGGMVASFGLRSLSLGLWSAEDVRPRRRQQQPGTPPDSADADADADADVDGEYRGRDGEEREAGMLTTRAR